MVERPSALRADLQQYYGIDLDRAKAGAYTAAHVAALVTELPQDSRCMVALNPENRWTLQPYLLGTLINVLGRVFGGKDARALIELPGQDMRDSQTIKGQAMSAAELMDILARPRTAKPKDAETAGADG